MVKKDDKWIDWHKEGCAPRWLDIWTDMNHYNYVRSYKFKTHLKSPQDDDVPEFALIDNIVRPFILNWLESNVELLRQQEIRTSKHVLECVKARFESAQEYLNKAKNDLDIAEHKLKLALT